MRRKWSRVTWCPCERKCAGPRGTGKPLQIAVDSVPGTTEATLHPGHRLQPTTSTHWPGKSWGAVSIISARKARSWYRRRQSRTPTRTKSIGCGRPSSRAGKTRRHHLVGESATVGKARNTVRAIESRSLEISSSVAELEPAWRLPPCLASGYIIATAMAR